MGQISPIFFIIFYNIKSSSTFTVPKGVKKIDVFCVGGGGNGTANFTTFNCWVGGGGGGGYTSTKLGVDVTPGQQLAITVGYIGLVNYQLGKYGAGDVCGGTSSIGDICSAKGGNVNCSTWYFNDGDYQLITDTAYGGSGGGAWGCYNPNNPYVDFGGAGGIDGSDGYNGAGFGGKGQGTTTRYFGESNGTLYSTGGCGVNVKNRWTATAPGDGGSCGDACPGICIIRWDDQKS